MVIDFLIAGLGLFWFAVIWFAVVRLIRRPIEKSLCDDMRVGSGNQSIWWKQPAITLVRKPE